MTAERVVGRLRVTETDLGGKRLGAVAHSSGAEYLDERHLRSAPFDDLGAALTALKQVDAVVNGVGARFKDTIKPPQGVLEPAYMAIALPPGKPPQEIARRALVGITGSRSRTATSDVSDSHTEFAWPILLAPTASWQIAPLPSPF
jgi:polar amino acid transport system substrate-binding protein